MPLPHALSEAIDHFNLGLLARPPSEAHTHWTGLALQLAREWFRDIPEVNGVASFHPGIRFVAGCMLWPPAMVPDDWIVPIAPMALTVNYNPFEPETWHGYQTMSAYAVELEEIIVAALGQAAARLALQRAFEQALAQVPPAADEPMAIVVPTGLNSKDWRAISTGAADWDPTARRNATMQAEGLPKAERARRLGLPPSSV